MVNKNFLIWLNILLFLFLLLIIFEKYVQEENIYDEPALSYLGMSEEEIVELYGEPDFEDLIGGPGGRELYYMEERKSFIFAGDSEVVNNLRFFSGKELLGVEVGMTFDEITDVLGTPRERGFDSYSGKHSLVYFLGEDINGMGEVEIWFSAPDEDAPTNQVEIFWKKYWR